MKKLCLTLLCFHLLCGVGFATDSLVLSFGTVTGKTTFSKAAGDLSELKPFDYETAGSGWNLQYQKTLDNGFLFGGGYQNFEVSGNGSSTFIVQERVPSIQPLYNDIPIRASLETEKFKVDGIYGFIGYSFETTENLFFQPNLRLGLAHKYEAIYSFSTDFVEARGFRTELINVTLSASGPGNMLAVVLPLVYQVENLKVGGQIILPRAGFIGKAPDYEITSELSSGFQFMLGYNFSP